MSAYDRSVKPINKAIDRIESLGVRQTDPIRRDGSYRNDLITALRHLDAAKWKLAKEES